MNRLYRNKERKNGILMYLIGNLDLEKEVNRSSETFLNIGSYKSTKLCNKVSKMLNQEIQLGYKEFSSYYIGQGDSSFPGLNLLECKTLRY